MDLSIAVINWNTSDLLVDCLRSVVEHGQNLEYKLTVVDNGSTDADVRGISKDFRNFQWKFNQDNTGGCALNEAWDQIRGRYFLFLGPDAQIQAGCLQELVRFLDSHPEAGGVSGQLLNPDGSIQHYCRRLPTLSSVFFCWTKLGNTLDREFVNHHFIHQYKCKDIRLDSTVEVQQPSAACLLIRSELVREKSGLIIDRKFPFYFNDVDLCKRVYDAGYRIFVLPDAKVIHHLGSSFVLRDEGWKLGENHASLLRYLFKHHVIWAWAFYGYSLCETLTSLVLNHIKSFLTSDSAQLERRIQEGHQILSRIAVFFIR